MNGINHRRNLLWVVPFSLVLVVINFIRIVRIPITHDETGYSPDYSYWDLVSERLVSANNHIFHSVLRKFFVETFADNEFFLRLDSGLAHIVFIIFSYLLCKQLFKVNFWLLGSFILLNIITPFVFNFWGLSRGYALGMCLMTVSTYYLLVFEEKQHMRFLIYSLLAGILTVWSNFSLINFYVALSGVIVLKQLLFRKQVGQQGTVWKELLILLVSSVGLALLITVPILRLRGGGEMAFLGTNGFFEDTVISLAVCSTFCAVRDSLLVLSVSYFAVAAVLMIAIYWVVAYFKQGLFKRFAEIDFRKGFILSLLMTITVASEIGQHMLLNVNYLVDRTAVFMILLFAFQLIYFVYYLRKSLPRVSVALFSILFLLISYNFLANNNLNVAFLWWYDKDDMVVLNRIVTQNAGKKDKVKVCVNWAFLPSFLYDIPHHFKGKSIEVVSFDGERKDIDTTFDYYYIEGSEGHKIAERYVVDTTTDYGAFILCKRK